MKNITVQNCIIVILVIVFIVCLSTSCTSAKPKNVLDEFFSSLNNLDFTTAELLTGENGYYENVSNALESESTNTYENLQSLYFVKFIYSNIAYEVLDYSKEDDYYLYECKIYSYNAEDVLNKVSDSTSNIIASEEYISSSDETKYSMLCENLSLAYEELPSKLQKAEGIITIKIMPKENSYIIDATLELFKALGGSY